MRTPPGTDQPLWKTTAHLSLVYVATAYRWQPYLSQCAACGPCRFSIRCGDCAPCGRKATGRRGSRNQTFVQLRFRPLKSWRQLPT